MALSNTEQLSNNIIYSNLNLEKLIELYVNNGISHIHTSVPGFISKFNSITQRAEVQIGLKYFENTKNRDTRNAEAKAYPLLLDVPVQFPRSNGYSLTFPINEGDECMIFFSERSAANFKASGGIQKHSSPGRRYDINDAFCIPGNLSATKIIPDFQNDCMELRTDDRSQFVQVKANGSVNIKANTNVSIEAPTVSITGNLDVTGTISGGGNGIDLATHKHIDSVGGETQPPKA